MASFVHPDEVKRWNRLHLIGILHLAFCGPGASRVVRPYKNFNQGAANAHLHLSRSVHHRRNQGHDV